jgi:hypothetical protein
VTDTDRLQGMTQDRWELLTEAGRARLRDLRGLTPQLAGMEGKVVEVTEGNSRRRFRVGRSTGWRPCHLEMDVAGRNDCGDPAAARYDSVQLVARTAR